MSVGFTFDIQTFNMRKFETQEASKIKVNVPA